MAMKAMTLVGLDAHARQTHAAIVDSAAGELRVVKLRMPPVEVASFLEGLGPEVVAVYEAGPTAAPPPEPSPCIDSREDADAPRAGARIGVALLNSDG